MHPLVAFELHRAQFVGELLAVHEAAQEEVVATLADQRMHHPDVDDAGDAHRVEELELAAQAIGNARAARPHPGAMHADRGLVGHPSEHGAVAMQQLLVGNQHTHIQVVADTQRTGPAHGAAQPPSSHFAGAVVVELEVEPDPFGRCYLHHQVVAAGLAAGLEDRLRAHPGHV